MANFSEFINWAANRQPKATGIENLNSAIMNALNTYSILAELKKKEEAQRLAQEANMIRLLAERDRMGLADERLKNQDLRTLISALGLMRGAAVDFGQTGAQNIGKALGIAAPQLYPEQPPSLDGSGLSPMGGNGSEAQGLDMGLLNLPSMTFGTQFPEMASRFYASNMGDKKAAENKQQYAQRKGQMPAQGKVLQEAYKKVLEAAGIPTTVGEVTAQKRVGVAQQQAETAKQREARLAAGKNNKKKIDLSGLLNASKTQQQQTPTFIDNVKRIIGIFRSKKK